MSRPLRVGLVGCGRIAERGYVPALARAAGVELVAVADVEPARCAAVAPGVPAFDSLPSLVAEAGPEALVVATPPWTHLAVARLAAEAGLPVLVEKPPAADAGEARELAGLEPPPWMGFNRRFEPALQRLKARVPASGPLALTLELTYERASWDAHVGSGDALLDLGAHLVDLGRWLTGGEVTAARADAVEERLATVRLELDRGAVRIAVASDRPYRERFEVRDGRGRVVGRYVAGGLPRRLLGRLRPSREHLLVPSLAAQLEAFAGAVRGEPAPLLGTALDGLAVMEALDAARRSSEHQ